MLDAVAEQLVFFDESIFKQQTDWRFGEYHNGYPENLCTLRKFLYDICASVETHGVIEYWCRF